MKITNVKASKTIDSKVYNLIILTNAVVKVDEEGVKEFYVHKLLWNKNTSVSEVLKEVEIGYKKLMSEIAELKEVEDKILKG